MKRVFILMIARGALAPGAASAHWRNAFDTVLKSYDRVRLTLASNSLDGEEEYRNQILNPYEPQKQDRCERAPIGQ